MIIYIALIALAFIGFAVQEYALNRDLSAAAPGKEITGMRQHISRAKSRFEPVAAGTRMPTQIPAKVSPLALTRHLGTHA